MQFEWQAVDRVSREEVARAIAQAEADIERELGYHLLPAWDVDEWHKAARSPRPEWSRQISVDVRKQAQTVQAKWGYLLSGGIRQKDLAEAATAIVWSDTDGDGYTETGTVTVAVTAGTPESEMHVYYPGESGEDAWEIRPVAVSIAGAVATITFRRELCVIKAQLEIIAVPADDSHIRGLDGALDANFLTTVDVYRVYNDPQSQATFLWEPFGTGACASCNGTGCNICAYSAQTGCLMLRDEPRLSIVSYRPATWDQAALDFAEAAWTVDRQPALVRLYYYSGWQDKNLAYPTIQMDRAWERAVAYYAASLLDRPVCECNNVHAWVESWRRDLAIAGEDGLKVSAKDLDCPFGTKRGAVFAWKRVNTSAAIGRTALV